jgi:hypothetical protein
MTTTFSTATTNPHIAALQVAFGKAANPIDWLVIAHNDSQMLRALSFALTGESAAILEVPQQRWDFHNEQLSEAIEWALQHSQAKNLLLVGTSDVDGAASRASLVALKSRNDPANGYARLLAGLRRNDCRNRDAQKWFGSHVRRMSELVVVHNRWSSGELAVHGLFYRSESGLFLAYDVNADLFRPLVSHEPLPHGVPDA